MAKNLKIIKIGGLGHRSDGQQEKNSITPLSVLSSNENMLRPFPRDFHEMQFSRFLSSLPFAAEWWSKQLPLSDQNLHDPNISLIKKIFEVNVNFPYGILII